MFRVHELMRIFRARRKPAVIARRALVAWAAIAAAVSVHAACSAPPARPGAAYPHATGTASRARGAGKGGAQPPAARTREPSAAVSVLAAAAPGDLTARFARTLFGSSPVVVVAGTGNAGPGRPATGHPAAGQPSPTAKTAAKTVTGTPPAIGALTAGARAAAAAHAPLLLAAGVTVRLAAAIRALHPRAVLALGLPPAELAAELPGIRVVTRAASLPVTASPAPLGGLAVLVRASGGTGMASLASSAGDAGEAGTSRAAAMSAAVIAITVTARAAGATVVDMPGPDPRAYPPAIRALARLRPGHVVAVGASFGPAARLRARLAVAETGRQLPGGGQLMFPGRRLVALYGHPGAPGLGVLGHQDLPASITRAKSMAAAYRPLSGVPVVPAFEIIASVAEAAPGPDGTYSAVTPVSELLPWVREATESGLYVVLDLQAGRASLLAQAKDYQSLLKLPGVGLALDPEWKLTPSQQPLHQIGHVDIAEANSVIRWLAALTARYRLPQKLLVLHQFRLDMLPGEQSLDTSHDDLAIVVHMDGQGTQGQKQATWDAVTAAAPHGVYFGWKNFLVMDHPMLSPRQTMTKTPAPVMISYQ